MKRTPRVFHAGPAPEEYVSVEGESFHYLSHVLRVRCGEFVHLFGGGWPDREYEVEGISGESIRLRYVREIESSLDPVREILLAIAVGKGKKLEEIVESTTALGVARILPFVSDRSVAKRSNPRTHERLELLATQACRQCGRSTVPVITEILPSLESVVPHFPESVVRLFPDEQGGEDLISVVRGLPAENPVILFIGPEGGWSERERCLLRDVGAIPVSLGPRILRTELAAIVAVALTDRATSAPRLS